MIWTPKRNPDEFISINFMPDYLTLCAIKKTDPKITGHHFQLKALTGIPFSHDEYNEGRVYNPTAIGNHITNFLSSHGTKKTPIAFTISGNHIAQQFISCPTASPWQPTSSQSKQQLIDSCSLYPEENGSYMHYTCTIERAIVMQYQLMAIAHKLNLQSISTAAMAHLNLYRFLQNNSVCHTSLASILEKNNNDTTRLVCPQTIQTIAQIPAHVEKSVGNHDEIRIALGAVIPFIQPERLL